MVKPSPCPNAPIKPPVKSGGLACEAKKAPSFEVFEKAYLWEIKHGTYWHVTTNPCFEIDPEKGPRDMSSMADGGVDPGKLMVTSDLAHWTAYYGKERAYAAEIDLCAVPSSKYRQVGRGFGNEFWVDDPKNARVVRVLPVKEALRADRDRHAKMPDSQAELRRFYDVHHSAK